MHRSLADIKTTLGLGLRYRHICIYFTLSVLVVIGPLSVRKSTCFCFNSERHVGHINFGNSAVLKPDG